MDRLDEQDALKVEYVYDGDKLLEYAGETFEYDNLGNPVTYRNKALVWQKGRQLVSYDNHNFVYDGFGRRIEKDGLKFIYDRDGRLIKQSNGLEFFYDHMGVMGLKYEEKYYFYRRDTQKNIIGILDNTGKVVVRYTYDSWGNHDITVLDSSCEQLANLNPFRYRGYYYDTETDLYFLKTRYYDPEIGRFISIDGISYLNPNAINGLNLYAYCNNNPVMNVDPNGNVWYNPLTWDWQWVQDASAALTDFGHKVEQTVSNVYNEVKTTVVGACNSIGSWVNDSVIPFFNETILGLTIKDGSIEIGNSKYFITPGIQLLVSFYLNHINPDTRDIIRGTTIGVQREWEAHNLAYYGLSGINWLLNFIGIENSGLGDYIGFAEKTGIGATIFSNSYGFVGIGLRVYNLITSPLATIIDYFIAKE